MIDLLAPGYDPPGELLESNPHEHAADAMVHRFRVDGGFWLVTVWRGRVHEVIHQTPCESELESDIRNRALFEHYGEGQEWNEVLDNGFGKTYRRADMERYALWSYAMDYNTFGTMAFHEVMGR